MSARHVLEASFRLRVVWAIACVLAPAAYPQSTFIPPPGDLQVFYIYLRQAHRAISALRHASTEDPLEVDAGLARRTAGRLRVNVEDLSAVERAYQSATAELSELDADARAYVIQMKSKTEKPDTAKLLAYHQRRTAILQRTTVDLQSAIGAASWLRLSAYIDGEFRMHVKRRKL